MSSNLLALSNLEALPPIILASGSPRRKELLESLGIPFNIVLSDLDEKDCDVTGLNPAETVLRLARFKGEPVAAKHPDKLVIAADTLVAIREKILGKPLDEADAFAMLSLLQGNTHSVFSGIAVFYGGQIALDVLETKVTMRPLSPTQIERYIKTKEPMDKAGSYAIQGQGSILIEKIDGCYFNVVGMSLILLDNLITRLLLTHEQMAKKAGSSAQ